MKKMPRRWLWSLLAAAFMALPVQAAEDGDEADGNPFDEVAAGEYVNYEIEYSATVGGKEMEGEGTITYSVTEKTDKEITLKVATVVNVVGVDEPVRDEQEIKVPLGGNPDMETCLRYFLARTADEKVVKEEITSLEEDALEIDGEEKLDIITVVMEAEVTMKGLPGKEKTTFVLNEKVPVFNILSFVRESDFGAMKATITGSFADAGQEGDDAEDDEDTEDEEDGDEKKDAA